MPAGLPPGTTPSPVHAPGSAGDEARISSLSVLAERRSRRRAPEPGPSVAADVRAALPAIGLEHVVAQLAELYDEGAALPILRQLLGRSPELAQVLLELPAAATRSFGPHTRLRLERFDDRDGIGDGELMVVVDAPVPRVERRRLLRAFDRAWWLPRTCGLGSRMILVAR